MKNYPAKDIRSAEKYVLRLLAIRARSEYEIDLRLKNKGFSESCRTELIQALKKRKLLDDVLFASEWASERMKIKPRSIRLIRQELSNKGIDDNIITRVLNESEEILGDKETSVKIVRRQMQKIEGLPENKKKIKLYRILLARGFDEETSAEAVDKVLNEK